MIDKQTIAGRLKAARVAAGLSQGEVARRLKLHRPIISVIEAGTRNVSAIELTRFAALYEIPVLDLIEEKCSALEASVKAYFDKQEAAGIDLLHPHKKRGTR